MTYHDEVYGEFVGVLGDDFDLVTLRKMAVGLDAPRSQSRNGVVHQLSEVTFAAGNTGMS